MEERQVTIDGKTQKLEPPFFVVATENPVETAGTFPLPEAQMDRFLMKLSMGLPTREEEVQILDTYMTEDPLKKLTAVIDQETLERMQKEAMEVYVHPTVRGYLADLSAATRSSDQTVMGVSPRGTIALMRASRAWAYLEGRSFVTPDDVKAVAGHGHGTPRGAFLWTESLCRCAASDRGNFKHCAGSDRRFFDRISVSERA